MKFMPWLKSRHVRHTLLTMVITLGWTQACIHIAHEDIRVFDILLLYFVVLGTIGDYL